MTSLLLILFFHRPGVIRLNPSIAREQEQDGTHEHRDTSGDEREGRSKVVTRDVLEQIEWAMPMMMEIFCSGAEVVRFSPVKGAEDKAEADQATALCNKIFWNEGGFMFHWSVRAGDKAGGSGGTSTAAASKKAAEAEVARFREWLRSQPAQCTV